MNKITKKLMKSLLVTSALSLLHSTTVNAQELKHGSLDDINNGDNEDEIQSLKRKIIKNVVKVSPSGRMMMVNDHYSHSSHSSHSVIIRVVEVEADTIHIVHIAPTIRVPAALMAADTAVAVVIVVVLVKIPM